MGYTTKIATCCYCGARTALVLDKQRHELACASCGAPLHDMKSLPTPKAKPRAAPLPTYERIQKHKAHKREEYYAPLRPKKRKKRKSILRKVIEEAVDIIEDIID